MKVSFACCLLTLALGSAFAWAADPSDATATAIIALEKKWCEAEANNTPKLIEPILAEKAIFTESDGSVRTRTEFLAEEAATKFTDSALDNPKVTVFGNTAIVNYVLHQKGADKSGPFDRKIRETDTWVKMPKGAWQVVATHGSDLKKS